MLCQSLVTGFSCPNVSTTSFLLCSQKFFVLGGIDTISQTRSDGFPVSEICSPQNSAQCSIDDGGCTDANQGIYIVMFRVVITLSSHQFFTLGETAMASRGKVPVESGPPERAISSSATIGRAQKNLDSSSAGT